MKLDPRRCGFATRAIHLGHDPADRPEDATRAITVPIYQTSTYEQPGLVDDPPYEYARVQNPTRAALERNVAGLEGGRSGHAFASGMAAIQALLSVLSPGEEVVVSRDVYGGTNRYFNQVLRRFGVGIRWVDTSRVEEVEAAVAAGERVRMVYVETPSNPLMEITDLAAVAEIAHRARALLVVDNTFMTPYFQRPLELGADAVVHSTTKFLNGHSDSLGGVAITAGSIDPAILAALPGLYDGDLAAHLAFMQKSAGGVLAPFECFLVLRGLRTLAVRMEQHEDNGQRLAAYLARRMEEGSSIDRLLYPGLDGHPGHAIQRRQAGGAFGAMISFDLGSREAARRFLEALEVFTLAESLGGVESLACLPASMTHASVPAAMRRELGISDSLIRLSVGLECYEDLEADVEQALERASAA
ncbi:MAG: PLP-dependent transferase [Acidobacteria bacterium]|nr:MAG: PLP-dependent transferase [Acidobacteriota bacterium]